jgi:hypothetical protein
MSRTPKILSCHFLKFSLAKASFFEISGNSLPNDIVAAAAELLTREMAAASSQQ